jgi:tRNA(Ile)-lysidine synthase
VSTLHKRVLEVIKKHKLWEFDENVAVAVSGGRDSVVLLDLLVTTQRSHGAKLHILHVDHGVRTVAESEADENLIKQLAIKYDLPYNVFHAHLGSDASEEACRIIRYNCFRTFKGKIALGHHERDQVETFFLNVLRGAGSRALSCMPTKRHNVVRPLLSIADEDIQAWAEYKNLFWLEDSTNADTRYLRNALRQVLPSLLVLRAGSAKCIARTARNLAEDNQYLEMETSRAKTTKEFHIPWVVETPKPLVRRALLRQNPTLSAKQIDAIVDRCIRENQKRTKQQLFLYGIHIIP